jgi:hypothetical protein
MHTCKHTSWNNYKFLQNLDVLWFLWLRNIVVFIITSPPVALHEKPRAVLR